MADLRVPTDPILSALGLDVTVNPTDETPIATTGIWSSPHVEDLAAGAGFGRRERIDVLALPRAVVTSLPTGALIDAASVAGGTVFRWQVERIDRLDDDFIWAIVVKVEGEES